MKETRFFYVPHANECQELPPDEAAHAVRVLRLQSGDEIYLIDGEGCFHRAEVSLTSSKHCCYIIKETIPQEKTWKGRIHLVMAPTKMMERVEWMAEKATEIGIDELSFLDCRFSERKVVKTERVERIVVAAVKQSRKAWMPLVNPIIPFVKFINTPRDGAKYIAHCYEEIPRYDLYGYLCEMNTDNDSDVTILIGPEGDFSADEVRQAIQQGYIPVSLGQSRLRTETAALYAVMMANLSRRLL